MEQLDESATTPRRLSDPESTRITGDAVPKLSDTASTVVASPSRLRANLIPDLRLVRPLGAGASATVFLAESDEGEVAVKLLSPEYLHHPEVRSRWIREANLLIGLNHPNIVKGLRHGVAEGRPYFVMEYLRGETLEARFRRLGPLPDAELLAIARDVLQGLSAAADLGITHRDIKPTNLIRIEGGSLKIMDFGLAKTDEDAGVTLMGAVIGTPAYLAPEQAQGDLRIDSRSDLYSLGATLYHLATGEIPFSTMNISLMLTRKITQDVPDPRRVRRTVGAAVAGLILRLGERRRERRPTGPREALQLLEELERGNALPPEPRAAETPVRNELPTTQSLIAGAIDNPLLRTVVGDAELRTKPIALDADEVLFYEDDGGKDAYVLLSGGVEIIVGGRQVAVVRDAGSFIGEMSVLRKAPRSATVRALERTALIKIEEAEFQLFLRRHPDLNYELARSLAERLDKSSRRLAETQSRLARVSRRLRELEPDLIE